MFLMVMEVLQRTFTVMGGLVVCVVVIMEDFFTKYRNNQDKWDFIEQYFLGRDVLNQPSDNYFHL